MPAKIWSAGHCNRAMLLDASMRPHAEGRCDVDVTEDGRIIQRGNIYFPRADHLYAAEFVALYENDIRRAVVDLATRMQVSPKRTVRLSIADDGVESKPASPRPPADP